MTKICLFSVAFYKRAQILIADVWACCEGEGLGAFTDIDDITMFADYRCVTMGTEQLFNSMYGLGSSVSIQSIANVVPIRLCIIAYISVATWNVEILLRMIYLIITLISEVYLV